MFDEVLEALCRHGCRFVVVGSTARALAGEAVVPRDLDLVVDTSVAARGALGRALVELGAVIETREGWRHVERCEVLPWEWGFRVITAFGEVDLVGRFVDDTTIDDHDAAATTVRLGSGTWVRIHPTRHVEAA